MWQQLSNADKKQLAHLWVCVLDAERDPKNQDGIEILGALRSLITEGMGCLLIEAGLLRSMCAYYYKYKKQWIRRTDSGIVYVGGIPPLIDMFYNLIDTTCKNHYNEFTDETVIAVLKDASKVMTTKVPAGVCLAMIKQGIAAHIAGVCATKLILSEQADKARKAKAMEKRLESENLRTAARDAARERRQEQQIIEEAGKQQKKAELEMERKKAADAASRAALEKRAQMKNIGAPIKRTKAYTADDHQEFITQSILFSLGL